MLSHRKNVAIVVAVVAAVAAMVPAVATCVPASSPGFASVARLASRPAAPVAARSAPSVGSWPLRPFSGEPGPSPEHASRLVYRAPVLPLVVVRPFRPPPTPYAAGHRGVDLAVAAAGAVVAAGSGRVSFAGSIAGRGVVVIQHADGVRTEYEPLIVGVRTGQMVSAGDLIGRVRGVHGSCAPDRCLHWGARRHDRYFDPLTLLRPLGPVRLMPWP